MPKATAREGETSALGWSGRAQEHRAGAADGQRKRKHREARRTSRTWSRRAGREEQSWREGREGGSGCAELVDWGGLVQTGSACCAEGTGSCEKEGSRHRENRLVLASVSQMPLRTARSPCRTGRRSQWRAGRRSPGLWIVDGEVPEGAAGRSGSRTGEQRSSEAVGQRRRGPAGSGGTDAGPASPVPGGGALWWWESRPG